MMSHLEDSQVNTYAARNRLKSLRREERRFMLAYKDEKNNEAMAKFCEAGLAKIRREIAQIKGLIMED